MHSARIEQIFSVVLFVESVLDLAGVLLQEQLLDDGG
jgi:hypothetical protein